MKYALRLTLTCVWLLCFAAVGLAQPRDLLVSSNGRYLVKDNGQPFFWLGDTAWELTHKLDRSQIDTYLADRQARGYNVIQTVGLAERDGLTAENPYGHLPLANEDPTRPNDSYFQHVDYAIDQAAARGMYVAFLPTWGDKVDQLWGTDNPIFDPDYQSQGETAAKQKAYTYGKWIGERYASKSNVIFVLGGDRVPYVEQAVWESMAEGVEAGSDGQLMTFHPIKGWSSSSTYHNASWLDFNMHQSGQSETEESYDAIAADWNRTPVKPTIDAEPRYEGLGNTPIWVRRKAYWATFAGALGHTYGHYSLWKMQRSEDPNPKNEPTWDEALSAEGGDDMRHLKSLMESRPLLDRIPDQSLITSAEGTFSDRVQATRDAAGTYAMIYSSDGQSFDVDLTLLTEGDEGLVGWWYEPRDGSHRSIAGLLANSGTASFTPPTSGEDWVLVLDAANTNYPQPGGYFEQPLDTVPEPASLAALLCGGGLLLRRRRRRICPWRPVERPTR